MASRILGDYSAEYRAMLAFIDETVDLPETPAQFQERCGQIALACFWRETRGLDVRGRDRESARRVLTHCP